MEFDPLQERFDTGLNKIRHEIKSRLVLHGLFGTVNHGNLGESPEGARVEIHAKGKTVARSFDRAQIEGCCLRVGGTVLSGILAMVDELAPAPKSPADRPIDP
jgi:hypothetical protein